MRRVIIAMTLAALGGGSAWAQEEEADAHRTAFSIVGGLSVGSSAPIGRRDFGFFDSGSETGFVAGGGVAHDLTPRLTLEASGLYLDRGSSAWSADAGIRLNLVPSSRNLVPYFAVSGGVFSERVETAIGRGLDVFLPGRTGRVVRDVFRGRGATADTFDSRRTDGMLTLGGGVRLASGSHVFVRPDVRAQIVFSGDTRVLGLFTLNFGYRF